MDAPVVARTARSLQVRFISISFLLPELKMIETWYFPQVKPKKRTMGQPILFDKNGLHMSYRSGFERSVRNCASHVAVVVDQGTSGLETK